MRSVFAIRAALLAGVFMLSSSAIFGRLSAAPPSVTAFYRLLFATCALLPALLFSRGGVAQLRSASRRQIASGVLAGVFLAVHYIMWFESIHWTTVSSSTTIAGLQPLFSIILGMIFLDEHLTRKAALGGAIAIAGAVVIGLGDFRASGTALWGDVLALISGAVISVYFFFGQICRRTMDALPYSVLSYSSSVVFLAAYTAVTGSSFTGYDALTWKCFLGLAFVSTIGGQMVFNVLLRWITATEVTMGILAEPIGVCILAWYFLGELPTPQLGIGIVLILGGLWLFFAGTKKAQ